MGVISRRHIGEWMKRCREDNPEAFQRWLESLNEPLTVEEKKELERITNINWEEYFPSKKDEKK